MTLIPTLTDVVPDDPENIQVVDDNFTIVRNVINGQLEAENVAASAIADRALGSPVNQIWRTIFQHNQVIRQGGTLFGLSTASGNPISPSTVTSAASIRALRFGPSDLVVAGLSARFRLRAHCYGNNVDWTTVPTRRLDHHMGFLDTVAGSGGQHYFSSYGAVDASHLDINMVINNSIGPYVSTEWTVAEMRFADGAGVFALGYDVDSVSLAGSVRQIVTQLQVRFV